MLKATFTSLWSRKLRMGMAMLAIVLGVAFVSGSFVFSDMIMGAFKGLTQSTIPDVDVSKDMTAAVEGGSAVKSELNQSIVDKVKQVEGVQNAQGLATGAGVVVIDKKGKALASFGPPQIGSSWGSLPALEGQLGINLISGHEPQANDQVVLDPSSLEKSGYALGDKIKVITPTKGTIEVTVVGTGTFGNGSTAGATYVFLTQERAQELFLEGAASYTNVWVQTAPDADRGVVAERIQAILPQGYLARNGAVVADEMETSIGSALGFINTFLLVFAGIALLVASFLIVNTFTILVAQRSKEMALFRAMGSSRGQILGTVLIEALVMGIIGSLIGLFAGIGLAFGIKEAMNLIGWDLGKTPVTLSMTAIIVAMTTGVIVTLIASLAPAIRATRIAPIEAMTTAQTEQEKGLGSRAVLGVSFAALGTGAILLALFTKISQPTAWAGAGMAVAMIGAALASPLLGRPVVWIVGKAYRAIFGEVGKLAELNSIRQPRRTAATASALMIGLTLVSAMAIFGSSASDSVVQQVESTVRGDYLIGRQGFQDFPGQVADKAAKVDQVESIHHIKNGLFLEIPAGQDMPSKEQTSDVTGKYIKWVGAMEPQSFDRAVAQEITSGRMFSGTGEMIISEDDAKKENLGVGSTVSYYSQQAQRKLTVTVVGIYSAGDGVALFSRYISTQDLKAMGLAGNDVHLAIYLKPGADKAAARQALDEATADMPLISVMDVGEYTALSLKSVEQTMALLYALLGLSIVIAVLGIINTLALSIVERTREIGLLRAIALTRSEVRRMITLESVVIALLGAVVGVGLGTAFGVVLQRIMPEDQGIDVLSIPWEQLGAFLVAAAVVGVLAALWPAQRAAQTNILQAIAAE